tara:strand:+ start:1488 stop:1685 length:198 start_codon:yes stop_codon:yes gene_type:complete
MREGDLVVFRNNSLFVSLDSEKVGLIVEIQSRGPVPGAYVLWPNDDNAKWIKIENLIDVNLVVSQ